MQDPARTRRLFVGDEAAALMINIEPQKYSSSVFGVDTDVKITISF